MSSVLAQYNIHNLSSSNNAVLLNAAEFDAAGNHPQALQLLKDAAQSNDAEAIVALGKRLFFGDRSPQYFQEGLNLIQLAAQRNNGEALCQLACIHALGILPQSWQKAIDLLVLSAKQSWRPAQGQLIALCSNKSMRKAALDEKHSDDIWSKLATAIDLDRWLKPAAIHKLSDNPEIAIMSGFIPPAMCEWLIELGRPKLGRARVYDSVHNQEIENETRTNRSTDFTLMMCDVATLLVQAHISTTISTPVSHMETISVLHYRTGEQITPHYDFIDPKRTGFNEEVRQMGQRRMTFIIYLNEGYEGGETGFPKLNITNKGKAGDAIYFVNIAANSDPNRDTLHTGNPPLTGEKWIATQFVREKQVINIGI